MSLWRLLLTTACALHAVPRVHSCEELPVFSPSPLVVKRGDFATATCSICNNSCDYELRLEEAYQSSFKRGNQMVWNISSLRLPWSVNILCYIFDSDCPTVSLDVIVYKPPENVSVSFKNRSGSSLESPSGPLKEGQVYCLQCEVEAVAPAQNMKVTFYRDFRELLVMRSSKTEKHPVSESFCLDYRVSREDHGATFWCEARLELGPQGPQPPPVVRSHNITAVVHYAPYSEGPEEPQLLTVNQGQSAELVCRAEGNPPPLYSWSLPSGSDYRGPVLTIPSASSQHEGPYTCTASNALGAVNRSFTLTVHVNYVPIIIAVVIVLVLLTIAVVLLMVYRLYYKQHCMGKYNISDKFRLHHHQPIPTTV
ncbi:nectin-4-like [Boleophthalmus pectinirostris]|uniref:nectin-4-like n=1 Tax=Boleophthalmus pectinirostris TaxID=150288 RepID=UPI00242A36CD|nr:nectin-4-like [Boleophthalmus pectinirostris]